MLSIRIQCEFLPLLCEHVVSQSYILNIRWLFITFIHKYTLILTLTITISNLFIHWISLRDKMNTVKRLHWAISTVKVVCICHSWWRICASTTLTVDNVGFRLLISKDKAINGSIDVSSEVKTFVKWFLMHFPMVLLIEFLQSDSNDHCNYCSWTLQNISIRYGAKCSHVWHSFLVFLSLTTTEYSCCVRRSFEKISCMFLCCSMRVYARFIMSVLVSCECVCMHVYLGLISRSRSNPNAIGYNIHLKKRNSTA